jgi:peptidoglycan/LPS O-acetylase OafA/YrhL
MLAITAILIDFRLRILIAMSVALTLFFSRNVQITEHSAPQKCVHFLGMISYALFLVHFSVLMLTNALYGWLNLSDPLTGSIFMLMTWIVSLAVAVVFYYKIERPVVALFKLQLKKN